MNRNTLDINQLSTNHMVDDEPTIPGLALELFGRMYVDHRGQMWTDQSGMTYEISNKSDAYVLEEIRKAQAIIVNSKLPLTTSIYRRFHFTYLNVKYVA